MLAGDRLTFAWWNTGLCPSGKMRATEEQFNKALEIVNALIHDYGVDFLALGEVSDSILLDIFRKVQPSNYSLYDGSLREGRLIFDTGAFYNSRKLTRLQAESITVEHGSRKMKLANRIDFAIGSERQPLHLFMSHWPSHIQPDSETLRISLGYYLRAKVKEVMLLHKQPRIILMGDYNEEPFHECLSAALLASRDRTLVRGNAEYLYNPFWRHLGEILPYSFDQTDLSLAGTCFLKSGNKTKWKTVDQIIFSSAFLGNSTWHLNERFTAILPLTPKSQGYSAGIFDHCPVIAVIDKILQDGEKNND
jgi:hypothetical protein